MSYRFPAEFEPHDATWIAWPHHEPDWPGKLAPIPWVYAEIVRVLHRARARRDSLSRRDRQGRRATRRSTAHGVARQLFVCTSSRTIASGCATRRRPVVHDDDGARRARELGASTRGRSTPTSRATPRSARPSSDITELPRIEPVRPDTGERVVLEGGGIETDGEGTLLVTEEWLLSDDAGAQSRARPRRATSACSATTLGIRQTIWLGEGCVGDDTHGHVDDIARFTAPGVIVLAYEEDPADDENHRRSVDNCDRLELAGRRRRRAYGREASVPARRRDERRAAAGELREFLHRQRRRDRADVQRPQRSHRAEHARRAVSRSAGRRHPRRRSRLGTRHAALPDAAAAARVDDAILTGQKRSTAPVTQPGAVAAREGAKIIVF